MSINKNCFLFDDNLDIINIDYIADKYIGVLEQYEAIADEFPYTEDGIMTKLVNKVKNSSIVKYIQKGIHFLSEIWKKAIGIVKNFAGKITSKFSFKSDSKHKITYAYLRLQGSKVSINKQKISLAQLVSAFVGSIKSIVSSIGEFASRQVKALSSILSRIKNKVFGEAGRVVHYPGKLKADMIDQVSGEYFNTQDMVGKDIIDSENKIMTRMDDVYYKMILASDDIVKAYNSFLACKMGEYRKYIESCMSKHQKYLEDITKILSQLSEEEQQGFGTFGLASVNNHAVAKQIENVSRDLFDAIADDTIGNFVGGLNEILSKMAQLEVAGVKKSNDELVKEAIEIDAMYEPKTEDEVKKLRMQIQLRLNYNMHMRRIFAKMIKINRCFFELSKTEALTLAKQVTNTSSQTAHRKALELIRKFGKKFIEKPGKLNFRPVGGGIVYYNHQDFGMKTVGEDPSKIAPLAMRYKYIMLTHGMYSSDGSWRCSPIEIEGKVFDDTNLAMLELIKVATKDRSILHLGNKPITVFIGTCNTTHKDKKENFGISKEVNEEAKKNNILVQVGTAPILIPYKVGTDDLLISQGLKASD